MNITDFLLWSTKFHALAGGACLLVRVVHLVLARKWSGFGPLFVHVGLWLSPAVFFLVTMVAVCTQTDCLHGDDGTGPSDGGASAILPALALVGSAVAFWFAQVKLLVRAASSTNKKA